MDNMKDIMEFSRILMNKIIYFCQYLYSNSPWKKAFTLLALSKYTQSKTFRTNCKLLNKKYAIEVFTDYSWYWSEKITVFEKLNILFVPFSCIKKSQTDIRIYSCGWI